jgi:NAD(P)H-hydrate epimerase
MIETHDVPPFPPRPDDAHKGRFGTLVILGGSQQMIGAPMLAARGAYRAGCGLVQVAMPQPVLAAALSICPEAIGLRLVGKEGDVRRFRSALQRADAVVAGPGLGQEPQAEALLRAVYTSEKSSVIDADALNILAERDEWPADFRAPAVLTPHPGEMARLARHLGGREIPSDDAGRIDVCGAAAREFQSVVVLKGPRTVISDGERYRINTTGDNSLAKAGTGDVLAGLIGSLLAQGMPPFDAAVCGVHYHGLAGQAAGRALGKRAVLASDVAERLGEVMAGHD